MKKKTFTNLLAHCSLLIAFVFFAQTGLAQKAIAGMVYDAKTNEPIPGASIVVKNTTQGTVSDIDGKYQLNVSPKATLVVSFVGYTTQEVFLADQPASVNLFDVAMQQDDQLLKETVVVGYGTQRKSDLTGAISSVKGKDLQGISSGSVDQLLEGKISGVQVTPTSGRPGASAIIRVRGVGTLNDASPLFVVDGLLMNDISFLNNNDIESVETLKDASATAIYGSRGANGVIIITTKKGTKNSGKTTFTLNSYYGQQQLSKKIGLANATEYATLANEVLANLSPPQPPVFKDPVSFGVGTDWQNVIFQKAPIQNVNLSASGATDKMSYYISGDYFYQGGIVVGGDYQRLSLRLNNEYKLTDAVKLGNSLVFSNTSGINAADVIYNAYYADPTVAARDSNNTYGNTGNKSSVANPAAQIDYNKNAQSGYRALGNFYISIDFLKHFTFKTSVGLDLAYNQGKSFTPVFHVSPQQYNDINQLNLDQSKSINTLWENTLSYDNTFGKHRINVLVGYTSQTTNTERYGGSRKSLPGETPDFWYLDPGDPNSQTNFNSADPSSILSYLGRVNYTFNNKYLFTASVRRDGSSKFGVNNRYGNFPSFALGWRVKEEDFLKNVNWIDNLKLRASYGVIGNEKIGTNKGRPLIDNNLNPVFGNPSVINIGATATTLPNPDIKWESTAQTDVGLEMAFFRNRLTAEIDYYQRTTDGILIAVPIPLYVGTATFPTVNAAKVENKGIDLTLGWRDKIGDFGYNIGIIGSTVNNKVLALGQGNTELLFLGNIFTLTRTSIGSSIGEFFGYKTLGVLQNAGDTKNYPIVKGEVPGDLRFQDTNGDGVIDAKDRVNLGSPIPNLIYSFNLGMNYKGFDATVFFSGVSGNKILNYKKMLRFNTPNFESSTLNRWTGEGTSTSEPRVTNGGVDYSMSDRFLSDGSFLSLRNVQLGYTLTGIGKATGISSVRVYVAGTNLVMWSNYTGFTPQVTNSGDANNPLSTGIDGGVYPVAKTYTVGLNVVF